jgi:phosphoribosylaminoimidazolecarboxamide formyltransferase / IMP cyclohydrolase
MAFNSVSTVQDKVPVLNAIVSVYDKTGLGSMVEVMLRFCPGLHLFSTGGTYDFLAGMLGPRTGAHLVRMEDYTGQPAMKGGLVKTLDWKVYLGLLAEAGDEAHALDIERTGSTRFDMVIGNLYPFGEASAKSGSLESVRQHIDIGGPCMLRAAAKNFLRVASVCHPGQYAWLAEVLETNHGCTSLADRARLAGEVFSHQADYEASIATYLGGIDTAVLAASYRSR